MDERALLYEPRISKPLPAYHEYHILHRREPKVLTPLPFPYSQRHTLPHLANHPPPSSLPQFQTLSIFSQPEPLPDTLFSLASGTNKRHSFELPLSPNIFSQKKPLLSIKCRRHVQSFPLRFHFPLLPFPLPPPRTPNSPLSLSTPH